MLEFLILAGDHLYRMDYERFIQAHRETDADITVAALPMDEKRATAFGLMKIDEEGRIVEFAEKPKGDQLKAMRVDTTILGLDDERAKEMPYIASMGIYVVSKNVMLDLLRDKFPGANDFGSEVIPGATSIGMRVCIIYLTHGFCMHDIRWQSWIGLHILRKHGKHAELEAFVGYLALCTPLEIKIFWYFPSF